MLAIFAILEARQSGVPLGHVAQAKERRKNEEQEQENNM